MGRLRADARLCDYNIPAPGQCSEQSCTCAGHNEVRSFEEEMVKVQMVCGLYNPDHKTKLLSESALYTTVEQKLTRLTTLEEADEAMGSLMRKKDGAQTSNTDTAEWTERSCKKCQKKFRSDKFKYCSASCRKTGREKNNGKDGDKGDTGKGKCFKC